MVTKKNIREYKKNGNQFAYVLDSITNVETWNDEDFKSDKDRVEMFVKYFNEEFNHVNNKKLYPNLQQRIKEYLSGLPSVLSLPLYTEDIKNTLITLNVKVNSKKDDMQIYNDFYNCISSLLIQLANYYNIELDI